jgi:hypothetical protein
MESEKQREIILKFYLPDNRYDLKLAMNGQKYLTALENMYNYLREVTKYDSLSLTENQMELIYKVKEKFHSILAEENIDLQGE